MANIKISALPAAGALDGTEIVPVADSGVTKRTTVADIVGKVDLSNYQGNITVIQSDTVGSFRSSDGLADVQVQQTGAASISGTIQASISSPAGQVFATAPQIHIVADGGVSRIDLLDGGGGIEIFSSALGFFGTTAVTQPTGVTADDALEALGLASGVLPSPAFQNELWISGANFQGNANGFENPGGSGNYVAYDFPAGQNRYGIADIAIPTGWNSFSITYFVSNNGDANLTHNYVFESTYQLAGQGTVLTPTVVSHTQSFLNTGINALVVSLATPDITVSGAKMLNYLVRSNNATQEVTATVSLIGLLLTRVS